MYLRLSRLRIVLFRIGILCLIVLCLLQIRAFFYEEKHLFVSMNISPIERLFWSRLVNHDSRLTTEQKLNEIKLFFDKRTIHDNNWTRIFHDLYQRKLQKLDQRDRDNSQKLKFIDNRTIPRQTVFEIVEETPVSSSMYYQDR
jgi:hypothetical protein